jgi:hypothetical protein
MLKNSNKKSPLIKVDFLLFYLTTKSFIPGE